MPYTKPFPATDATTDFQHRGFSLTIFRRWTSSTASSRRLVRSGRFESQQPPLFVFVVASEIYSQAGETRQEQMNHILEGSPQPREPGGSRSRIRTEADRHLRQAERMATAGQNEEARAELELAAPVIADTDRSAVQE